MVSPAFAQVLRSGREHFNARFAAARRLTPGLDAAGFHAFLAGPVDGLVQAVQRAAPGREADVAQIAYDLALELAAQRLLHGGERARWIEAGWSQLLPRVARLAALEPARVLGAVTNALHTLASTPGARPGEWIERLARLDDSSVAAVPAWLALGQVAAWRAGLAHFRASALALADTLPPAAVLALLDAPPGAAWPAVAARLRRDPWHDPADAGAPGSVRVAGQAGAFRGFGGMFTVPPRVAAHGDHFIVSSGADRWVLAADAFGATLHRARPEEHAVDPGEPALGGRLRTHAGGVTFDGAVVPIPGLGEVTSAAANATTLALTSTLSHRVLLLALPAS